MAHLTRVSRTEFQNADGQRVPKGTPGAVRVKTVSKMWYGRGIPGQPAKKRVPLATDKTAARRMLADMVRRAEQGQAGVPDRDATRKSLVDYLIDFEADISVGLGVKGGRKRSAPDPKQARLTVSRARAVLVGCRLVMPADLGNDAPGKVARHLQGLIGKPRKEGGVSAQTAEFHLAAVRRFVGWLAKKVSGVSVSLFDPIPGFHAKSRRLHARREVSPEELARLIDTTRASTRIVKGLTGPDRAMLYLVAFATGYRAGELAELCPEWFDLAAEPPVVNLPARVTKNEKPSRQPIPPGVAWQLGEFLSSKPAGKPIWAGKWIGKTAAILRIDLAAAGVAYKVETPDGPRYADFHALRHSYLSALAAAGVGVKELQELARHSDPRLTLGVYTHARPAALGESVARLVVPGRGGEVNPLGHLTRKELEGALLGMMGVVAILTGCPLIPPEAGMKNCAPLTP
jgi:integrase